MSITSDFLRTAGSMSASQSENMSVTAELLMTSLEVQKSHQRSGLEHKFNCQSESSYPRVVKLHLGLSALCQDSQPRHRCAETTASFTTAVPRRQPASSSLC